MVVVELSRLHGPGIVVGRAGDLFLTIGEMNASNPSARAATRVSTSSPVTRARGGA